LNPDSWAWNKYAKPDVNVIIPDLHFEWDVAYEPERIKAVVRKNGFC